MHHRMYTSKNFIIYFHRTCHRYESGTDTRDERTKKCHKQSLSQFTQIKLKLEFQLEKAEPVPTNNNKNLNRVCCVAIAWCQLLCSPFHQSEIQPRPCDSQPNHQNVSERHQFVVVAEHSSHNAAGTLWWRFTCCRLRIHNCCDAK